MKVIEGYMPYLGYKTYYRIVGECKGGIRSRLFYCTAVLPTHTTILKY